MKQYHLTVLTVDLAKLQSSGTDTVHTGYPLSEDFLQSLGSHMLKFSPPLRLQR